MYQMAPGISVFFPAFNDEKTIGQLVETALKLLPRLTEDYEVLVINDGSTDGTKALVENLTRDSTHVRVIHHAQNLGYGAALRTGFQNATKDLIFYTDGDGQYDVGELKNLLPLMSSGCDVVNGYKIKRSDAAYRTFVGALYNRLARILFRLRIRDVDCDFRLLRRRAIQSIHLVSSSGVICVEMIFKLQRGNCTFVETPVHHYPRLHGRSRFFTCRSVVKTALDFTGLWFKTFTLR
jgi:glycosyltransferase involved in cell wall biosynthesis